MINNVYDVCHTFFYQNNTVFDKKRFSVAFYNDKFYSYSTIIGKIVDGRLGKILLLSNQKFSTTTAKHIHYLQCACPLEIVRVPVRFNQQDITVSSVINAILFNLDFYKTQNLSQKKNRDAYISNFCTLMKVDEKIQKVKKSVIKKYKPLFDDLQSNEAVRKLKREQREVEKINAKKIKEKIAKYLKKYNISELARMVYDKQDHRLDGHSDLKVAIKKYLNPKDDLAYVWDSGDKFQTSRGIKIDKKECELIIKLYKEKKLKHGFRLGCYTVLEITEKFVKIGCHKIPVANIDCLLSPVNDKQMDSVGV